MQAVYLGNRCPTGKENKIPYEEFTGRLPIDRSFLKKLLPFGVNAYVHIPKQQRRKKLDCRARPGIFVGVQPSNSAYQIYYPDTESIVATIQTRFQQPTTTNSEVKEAQEFQFNKTDIKETEQQHIEE